jgi:hypothetical protein
VALIPGAHSVPALALRGWIRVVENSTASERAQLGGRVYLRREATEVGGGSTALVARPYVDDGNPSKRASNARATRNSTGGSRMNDAELASRKAL